MKLLFDQNISYRILHILPKQYEHSSHIKKEGLLNEKDIKIWEFAKQNNYTIITQDADFNDLNTLYGHPPKIIWIRTGNISTIALLNILIGYNDELEKFISDKNFGCFEIVKIINK